MVVSRIFGGDSARCKRTSGALSIQPKIPETSVGTYIWSFWSVGPKWPHPGYQRFFSRVRQGAWCRGWFPNPEATHETPLAPRVKQPFPFDKIVVPSAALLYPAYKNNNQTRGGLGRVCAAGMYRSIGHVTFPKFQTGIFVEWKAPLVTVERCPDLAACLARIVARRPLKLNQELHKARNYRLSASTQSFKTVLLDGQFCAQKLKAAYLVLP